MKLEKITETHDGDDRTRYVLSVLQEEIDILLFLLKENRKYIPKTKLSEQLKNRIDQMVRSFRFCKHANERFGKAFKSDK